MFLRKLFLTCGMLVYIIEKQGPFQTLVHRISEHTFDPSLTGPKQARPPMGLGILLAQMAPCEPLNWPTAV